MMETQNIRSLGSVIDDLDMAWRTLDNIIERETDNRDEMVKAWGKNCPGAVQLKDELERLKAVRDKADSLLLEARKVVN